MNSDLLVKDSKIYDKFQSSILIGIKLNCGKCWEGWLLLCWVLERFYDGMAVEKFAVEGW